MEVSFATKSMQKRCSEEKAMQKQWGKKLARKLKQRLTELVAATTLQDICRTPPARCHELKGNRKGQLSVDLEHPYRLIFRPDHSPSPRRKEGGLDWNSVTKVIVIEVADTH